MKKKLIAILLVAVLLVPGWCTQTSRAASLPLLNLSFVGNKAHCFAEIQGLGKINAQMELWHGTTVIASWSGTDYHMLDFNEICDVLPGYTYTLKLNGTIGGVAFQEVRVTRTNYEMNK